MSDAKPALEYPCAYPIKVLGLQSADFATLVVDIVRRHDPALREEHISLRESSGGKYLSVSVTITAAGPEHIRALFEDLKASGRVTMVL
jgi:uncharacterized protein